MMNQSARSPAIGAIAIGDLIVAILSLLLAGETRLKLLPLVWSGWTPDFEPQRHFLVVLVGSLPTFLLAFYWSGLYDFTRLRSRASLLAGATKAAVVSAVGIFAFAYAFRDHTFSRAVIALYLVLVIFGSVLVRVLVVAFLRARGPRRSELKNVVIVGTGAAAQRVSGILDRKFELGFRSLGFVSAPNEREADSSVPVLGTIDELPQLVDRHVVDAVIFAISLEEAAAFESIIWKLEEVGITVHMRGDAIGVLLSRTYVGEFEGIPMLTIRSVPGDPIALAVKRLIDVCGAAIGLLVLAPLLGLVALVVKATDRGPVFFRQERVGLNGRRIVVLKFRSMYPDAERRLNELAHLNEMTGPVFKIKNDPRITPIGKWIRKLSIDELPQLWNVLVGDMSLVGPRPPIPSEVEQYVRWQRRRLSMKPGITCLWQVGGRNNLDFDTWMKLDMEYIDNWSLALDLKILLRTIPVVISAKGAR